MKYLFVYTLIMLLHQTRVMGEGSCEERNITGAVGGAVTLHVPRTGAKSFSWSFGEKQGSFSITRPGEPADVLEDRYDGRLSSTSDGSLIIFKLRQQDQGTYQAKFRTDRTQFCDYHLRVFSNLTDANITITANLIGNQTCAANLTCSVNGSNVTTAWRSLNDTDDDQTQNVVFVPPSHINLTYICTARNPVSVASKVVHPWQYCMGDMSVKRETSSRTHIIIGVPIISIIVLSTFIACMAFRRNKKRSDPGNEEQQLEKGKKKKHVKDKREPPMCSANMIYSQVQNSQVAKGKRIQPKPANGKMPEVAKKSADKDNGRQKVKPKPVPGKPPGIANKPLKNVEESSKDQKTSSEGANGDPSKALVESCYAQVQLPKTKNNQVVPPITINGKHLKCADKALDKEPPKDNGGQKSQPKPVPGKPPGIAKKPLQNVEESPKGNGGQKFQPKPIHGKSPEVAMKPFQNVEESPKDNGGQKFQPNPVPGKPPGVAKKPLQNIEESPKDTNDQNTSSEGDPSKVLVESCYAQVQLPKDTNNQKTSSEGAYGDPSKALVETCYDQVQLPKDTNDQKTSSEGANGDPSKVLVESCYDQVQLPKPTGPSQEAESLYEKV